MQGEPLVLPPVCCYTGRVAAWAPFPQLAAAAAQSSAGTGLPPLKTSSQGVWLRSDAGGVLAVQWRPGAPPLLTCTLRSSQPLVRAPLLPGRFAFRLLCPVHGAPAAAAGGSSGHVLFLSLPQPGGASNGNGGSAWAAPGQQHIATIALHFDTPQAGRECGALLQAIQQGSLGVAAPPGAAPPAAAAPVPPGAAAQATAPGEAGSEAAGAAAAGVAAAHAAAEEWDGLFGFADEAALEAAIQTALADPQFLELAAWWERAVERVEGRLGG